MANPRSKSTPQERLARILKSGSTIPELAHFRSQCRDVFKLGGVMGLYEWVEARVEKGLLGEEKTVHKAADDLQGAIGSVIDAATKKPEPQQSGLSWDEKLERINKREDHNRRHVPRVGHYITRRAPTTAERMATAYDRLVGIDFASRGG